MKYIDQNFAIVVVERSSGLPIEVRNVSLRQRCYSNMDLDIMRVAEEMAVEYIRTYCAEIDIDDPSIRIKFLEDGNIKGDSYNVAICELI